MLTMQCAEIIQSVDNTMSRKRTGKINNWPPYSKIFQYIHVKCHKASKTLDLLCGTTAAELHKSVDLLCDTTAAELHNSVNVLCGTTAAELNSV